MRPHTPATFVLAACLLAGPAAASGAPAASRAPTTVSVSPASFQLSGRYARQQLVVSLVDPGTGRVLDRTPGAVYRSLTPSVARVSADGIVTPVRSGKARIRVRIGTAVRDVLGSVRGAERPHAFSFSNDIEPILTRAGCNSGTCHGKAEGKGGLRLSLFGYDPEADHRALLRDALSRRINRTDPGRSLMLMKATAAIPHGGGARFRPGSRPYRILAEWIAAGAPYEPAETPRLLAVSVSPRERAVGGKSAQRLLVTARYSDGSARDVTGDARYASNNDLIAAVDETGRVTTTTIPGEAAVMASYGGLVAVARILVPRPGAAGPMPPANNFVDQLVWIRLARLRIRPSGPASDSEFLRRAYLDLIGTLPTAEEARAFLAECESERARALGAGGGGDRPAFAARARLIDRLLERPEYADYWALKWADLLRVNREKLGAKGAYVFYRWIRDALAANMPYDRFVREIITARGSSNENGPVNLYRVLGKPDELAASVSQVFLGVRIECAQCHHHPFEKWSQDDYYGMVGFFTALQRKGSDQAALLSGGGSGEARHPKTSAVVPPRPLEGAAPDISGVPDRRQALADWMTAPENPYVSRMVVNRLWAHFLGRGLVEPVDDFRETNPPSNPALLDALAKTLVEGGYDLKRVIRVIMNSRVYQLSAASNPTNAGDTQNYSRAYPKRLSAEVLMDAVAQAAGSPPALKGLPRGTRAIQAWDSEWATQWQSYFLNAFGRPPRTSPCECERSQEPTIAQVLHLMNAPEIQAQISDRDGRARRLVREGRQPKEIVEELFLATYSRPPTQKEQAAALGLFETAGADRARAAEDVLWALMNTVEFVFNH